MRKFLFKCACIGEYSRRLRCNTNTTTYKNFSANSVLAGLCYSVSHGIYVYVVLDFMAVQQIFHFISGFSFIASLHSMADRRSVSSCIYAKRRQSFAKPVSSVAFVKIIKLLEFTSTTKRQHGRLYNSSITAA